jgi:hypothetical protein
MKSTALVCLLLCLTITCRGEQFFFIGDKEEDEIFSPSQVEEGPDGSIYIYDRRTVFISVFSPEGRFLRKMAGKGQGPGEIQRADGVHFNFTYDRKLLYFTEFFGGHRWITFMELSGKFHKVLKLKVTRNYAISRSLPLKDGGFLAQAMFPCETGKKGDYYLYRCPSAVITIDRNGEKTTEILRKGEVGRISLASDGADLGIPFVPVYQWVFTKGSSVIFSNGLSPVFQVYGLDGKKTAEIRTSLPEPQPVNEKDLDDWRRNLKENFRDKRWFARFGQVVDKYKTSIHKKKPNIDFITLTPGNHLLVEGPGAASNVETPKHYWLLDTSGSTLARGRLKGYGLKVSPNFVFLMVRDEEENSLLLVMKRKTGESEKDSLLRFTTLKID